MVCIFIVIRTVYSQNIFSIIAAIDGIMSDMMKSYIDNYFIKIHITSIISIVYILTTPFANNDTNSLPQTR